MNIAVSDVYVTILDLKWTDGAVALLINHLIIGLNVYK